MIEIKNRWTGNVIFTYLGADLRGADLRGADLRDAVLRGADLRDAKYQGVVVSRMVVLTGLYQFVVAAVVAEDGQEYIGLGCFFRSVTDWEADFWNNPGEFPNNGDQASAERLFAYQTALRWLDLQRGLTP